ncbi:MAG TPA: pseudouridine synthase [Ignavibacteriaceae bacterium]|nr:pseudouridine synthase [Ignavibacteriaceae bacterium]
MNQNNYFYFAINKPYGVLSQFSDGFGRKTLADFFKIPKNVYPVGRLDMDSEGLLLLANDKKLTDYLLNPGNKHDREYFSQVEGIPSDSELKTLEEGVIIEKRITLPAKIKMIEPPKIWDRIPPIRVRDNIPSSWISLVLVEGRNRQVRKMTAAIGHPTLRLIRVRIKNILLNDLKPGEIRPLKPEEIAELLS